MWRHFKNISLRNITSQQSCSFIYEIVLPNKVNYEINAHKFI